MGWTGSWGVNHCVSRTICVVCILTGTGASWRVASLELVVGSSCVFSFK